VSEPRFGCRSAVLDDRHRLIVGRTPGLAPSSATVRSARSASNATLPLKSAEYRYRLPVIGSVLPLCRTHLNHLSDFPGPPQEYRMPEW